MNTPCPALSEITSETLSVNHLAAVRRDGLVFLECAVQALGMREFVAEFDRLQGTNLQGRGTPLSLAIDDATGKMDDDMRRFLVEVWNIIFIRLPLVGTAG